MGNKNTFFLEFRSFVYRTLYTECTKYTHLLNATTKHFLFSISISQITGII